MIDQSMQERWDERYRTSNAIWSGLPNEAMANEVSELRPGRALDVGAGEGADAIWLARRGWHVTGVDISTVALQRAAQRAETEGVADRISWLHADVSTWSPPTDVFDLVSAQFLHLPRAFRNTTFHRLATAVAPGGSLLLVGHHPSDLDTGVPRPPDRALYFTAENLASQFDPTAWEILVSATRYRFELDRNGTSVRIADAVLRLQRRET